MKAADVLFVSTVGAVVGVVGWGLSHLPGDSALGSRWPWFVVAGGALVLGAVIAGVGRHPLVRTGLVGAGLVAAGWWLSSGHVPASVPGRRYWPYPLVVGVLLLVLVVGFGWHRWSSSSGSVRWSAWRNRRNQGVASLWAILRTSSAWAMRRRARVLRPSYRKMGFVARLAVRTREFATPLARVGWLRIWSPVEDVTLRLGGPRQGKTGELAGRILDAPGAVIATSTRTDLIELTSVLRSRVGPVQVFNPAGVGGLASTITFDPLSGCADPVTAATRAADLLAGVSSPGSDGGDREFWAGQARRVLAALMHAAALGEASMRDILAWLAQPKESAPEVRRFLLRSPEPAYELDALQFLETNERTQSSICATIMPALGWLTDPTAVAAAKSGDFDVQNLLDTRGTVYMLGAEDARTAPLVTALTGHIARHARRIAGHQPGGRLDPPLTLALDEAALICPIPLDEWTADMGGRNVTIHIAAQSRAQLRRRWGDTGAAAILNNTGTLLIYGGTRDTDDLQAYATLTGERYEKVPTWNEDGDLHAVTTHRVPVLSAAQIAQLRFGRVLIIRRGMAPAIGRTRMAWQRTDVRWAGLVARWTERLTRWTTARRRLQVRLVEVYQAAMADLAPTIAAAKVRLHVWHTTAHAWLEQHRQRRRHATESAAGSAAVEPAETERVEVDGRWTR